MNKETLYEAIGQIDDDIIEKTARPKKASRQTVWLRYTVAAACLCLVAAGSIRSLPQLWNSAVPPYSQSTPEDAAAKDPSVYFEDRQYLPLDAERRQAFGFSGEISGDEIGAKLGVISKGNDAGKEVYTYLPAGCEAVIAMKDGAGYSLYAFSAFESYLRNQDEDMAAYLQLYGIHSAADIQKVLIGERELETGKIPDFYTYFSALKNSSDGYFKSLKSGSTNASAGNNGSVSSPLPPDNSVSHSPNQDNSAGSPPDGDYNTNLPLLQAPVAPDAGGSGKAGEGHVGAAGTIAGSAPGSPGSNALADARSIKVYTGHGLYLEMPYYPRIGYISRHQVSSDFQTFLDQFLQ